MEDNNIENMPVQTTSYLVIFLKNLPYLSVLLFTYLTQKLMAIFPDWKESIDNFSKIGGALIVILVIVKLLLEIKKLKKK